MSFERASQGTITKVVRVAFDVDERVCPPPKERGREGYGLVRGPDGQEVFFVDTDVEDGLFSELRIGQTVSYRVQAGPLVRATTVRRVAPESSGTSCADVANED